MKRHNVIINSHDDYKNHFGDKYCINREIKHEYAGDLFVFCFENCINCPEIFKGFKQIKKKYENTIKFQSFAITTDKRTVEIEINSADDYSAFYDNFVDISNKNCKLKDLYTDYEFCFHIYFLNENKINEFLIHNYLLLRYRFLSKHNLFRLEIHGGERHKNENIARITTYVADCEPKIKDSIHFNGLPLFHRDMNIGKLFPAIFINKETLRFLREPLDPKIWDKIIAPPKIEMSSFSKIEDLKSVQKHWFLFQVCQKYLFDEFYRNASNKYTELRSAVFRNTKFKNNILRMPLLAVILFAQYDYFYRNSMLKEYKTQIGKNRLNWFDIVLDLQEKQNYTFFCKYREMFEKGENIKSLVKFKHFDKTQADYEFQDDNIIVHENIVAELFEATTIAEGLLQLMENAVEHANGGLLSIRIREYFDRDRIYLHNEYSTYFQNMDDSECAKFYLEVKLSDISEFNFKETFFNNVIARFEKDATLKEWYNKHGKTINNDKGIFSPFFEPDNETEFAWKEYYEISDNQIHHFGLQIFDSIITNKKGLLHISGHGDEYSKKEYKIDSDKNIQGTSYRILLPINHGNNENMNIIVDTSYENIIDFNTLENYKVSNNIFRICEPAWDEIKTLISEYKNDKYQKELVISKICNCFENVKQQNEYLLLLNYKQVNNPTNYAIELLLKGLLLFLLQNNTDSPPVAFINLPSHSLLEASRILALFYGKNGEGAKNMENIQIYLKGTEVGEEILFSGNNLNKIADRLKRIAMTRGIMFEYWPVAQILMQRTDF